MRICNEKETGVLKESKRKTRVPKTVKILYNQSYMESVDLRPGGMMAVEDYHSNSPVHLEKR
jgi:hypothetical protein